MKKYSFNFEQLDLISLFISAFDDAFVYRYDAATRVAKEKIGVRYINGPKQRVLFDLNDQAKALTLPVVTIEQTNLVRDASRVFHKHQHFYRPSPQGTNSLSKIPTPIPVNMDLSISIITKFKEDLDQIISNFAVHCNQYFVVSWKVPQSYGMDFVDEIRIEIEWDGNISYETPKDLSPEMKYRLIGNTSFTVKGWLFPSYVQPEAPIYKIDAKFVDVNLTNRAYTYDDYFSLSGVPAQTDVISISAYPEITNMYYSYDNIIFPITHATRFTSESDNNFLITGKRFNHNNTWYLSASETNFLDNLVEIDTANFPTISAYKLPENFVVTYDDNSVKLNIPENYLSASNGNFKIITSNEAGWGSSNLLFGIDSDTRDMYIQPDVSHTYNQPNNINTYLRP